MPTTVAEAELAQQLRCTVLRLARRIRAQRVDTSLSLSQLSALATLQLQGPLTAGEVAVREQLQPPTMTKILGALVDRELVVRAANPEDKRSMTLAVTAAGRATLKAEHRARDTWLTRELTQLDPAERERLCALLPILDRVGTTAHHAKRPPEPGARRL